jgi:hypothetical protein
MPCTAVEFVFLTYLNHGGVRVTGESYSGNGKYIFLDVRSQLLYSTEVYSHGLGFDGNDGIGGFEK